MYKSGLNAFIGKKIIANTMFEQCNNAKTKKISNSIK